MLTVVLASNPLDKTTWETFDDEESVADFLLSKLIRKYPDGFPDTARIYLDAVTEDNDITPSTEEEAEALHQVTEGTVYVVVWPGAPIAAQAAVYAAIALTSYTISHLQGGPSDPERVTSRRNGKGSPNNLPGDRQNTSRVLERIPDIYGRVKCTPDLIQAPYIRYEDNRQIEVTYMCIGQGTYTIDAEDVKEGDTPVSQIAGSSVEIYPPGEVPGSGTPQLTVGAALGEPIYNVFPIKEITPEPLLSPNSTVILGETGKLDGAAFDGRQSPLFGYPSTGVGTITYYLSVNPSFVGLLDTIAATVAVNDIVGLDFIEGEVSVYEEDPVEGSGGSGNRPDLTLLPETIDDDHYVVTGINTAVVGELTITLSVPVSVRPEWDKIALYNPAGASGGSGIRQNSPAPANTVYNRASILYVLNYVKGPFFVNDPFMQEIHVNAIAPNGLGFDDGRNAFRHSVRFAIRVTPCDELGIATGPAETYDQLIAGSSKFVNSFIGQSFIVTPTFQGRCLFECWRKTLTPFRQELRSYRGDVTDGNNRNIAGSPVFGSLYTSGAGGPLYLFQSQFNDEIQITHAYSMSVGRHERSVIDITNLGNITTVQCKRVQRKADHGQEPEKRLNMVVTRNVDLYDSFSGTFIGTEFPSVDGRDALFDVLRRSTLGNIPDSKIDLDGINDAFFAVTTAFGDAQSTAFSHTFDSKDASVEDMVSAIADACFVTVFRQGDIIKAQEDISTQDAALLFNHRNKVPDTETRAVNFATEEEYDGVEVEYTDLTDNQIKLYTIPGTGIPRNARKIQLAGIRTRGKAAMHAWRNYNRLLYQNMNIEFDAHEEASLGLVNERILVSNGTDPHTQDGDIIAIDGLNLYTSQEVVCLGTMTLHLQGFEGTVANVPVTQGPTKRSLTLAGPLDAGILIIDGEGNTYTKYILTKDTDPAVEAFRILDKSQRSLGVYNIRAYNYTDAYYVYDGVLVYLPFKAFTSAFPPVGPFDDRSPYEWEFSVSGTNGITNDPTRGDVYFSGGTTNSITVLESGLSLNSSYTVACWFYNEGTAGDIARSGNAVILGVSAGGEMIIFHDAVQYVNALVVPVGSWVHLAYTYDHDTLTMTVRINGGEQSAELAGTAPGHASFTDWQVCKVQGRIDQFRIWRKSQPIEFLRELYQKEVIRS